MKFTNIHYVFGEITVAIRAKCKKDFPDLFARFMKIFLIFRRCYLILLPSTFGCIHGRFSKFIAPTLLLIGIPFLG